MNSTPVLIHVIFLLVLYIVGVLFVYAAMRGRRLMFACITGFLWGSLWWVVIAVLLSVAGYGLYRWESMLGALTFLTGISWWQARRRLGSRQWLQIACSTAVFGAVSTFSVVYNVSHLSYDSYFLVLSGKYIAHIGGFSPELGWELLSWGVYPFLIQSAAEFLQVDYLHAAQPLVSYSGMAGFAYLTYLALRAVGASARGALAIVGLTVALLVSCFFLLWQFYYLHTNLTAGVYLFYFLACTWLAARENRWEWLAPAGMALIGFCLTRLEAAIFACALLALLPSLDGFEGKHHRRLASLFFIVVAPWYAYLASLPMSPADENLPDTILTSPRIYLILSSMAGVVVVSFLCASERWGRALAFEVPTALVYAITGTTILAALLEPTHMASSLYGLLANVRPTMQWQTLWGTFIVLGILAVSQARVFGERFLVLTILTSLSLVYLLAFFSSPYHTSYVDSGNRMLTHVVLLLSFYLALKYCPRNDSSVGATLAAESSDPMLE